MDWRHVWFTCSKGLGRKGRKGLALAALAVAFTVMAAAVPPWPMATGMASTCQHATCATCAALRCTARLIILPVLLYCLPVPQLYSVALYVEGELAAKELGIRYRGGFFETDDDYCSALVDGAFEKVLVVSEKRSSGGL
jgi:hypothetical protein